MREEGNVQALAIAGFDPGGGAGILADLRVFKALGLYGIGALTAITVQNTKEVREAIPLELAAVEGQLEALLDDFAPVVTKTGMLANPEVVRLLVLYAREGRLGQLVVDPVFKSSSGVSLFDGNWQREITALLPFSEVITPNIPEAELLTGVSIGSVDDAVRAASLLHQMGAGGVCITGGHLPGEPVDVVSDAGKVTLLEGSRHEAVTGFHGTGCLHSAALAGYLALGESLTEAGRRAQEMAAAAIAGAVAPGGGMKIPWHPLFS